MPLPKPTSGETPRDYVSRFMKDANAQEDFPEEGQRLAIAYSYLRRAGYDASAVAEMAASIDLAGEWDESLHPRGKGGEFASEGGAKDKGFTGRLLDVVLKAVGQPTSTRDEQMGLRVDPAQAFDLVGRHWGTGQWVSGPADHGTPAVERQRIQQTQGEHSYDPSTGQTFGDKGAVISDGLYARPDYGMDRAWQEARDASASAVAGPGLADRVSRDKEAVAYIADKLVPLQAEDARVDGWLQSAEQSLTSAEIALNDVALVRAAVRMEQAEAQAYATFGVKVLPSDAGLLPELRAHMWRAAEAKYASWLLGLAKTAAETAGPVAIANLSGEQPAPHTPAKPLAERTGEVQVTPIVAPLATAPKPDETSKNMDPGLTLVAKRAEKERQKIGVVAPNTIAPAINMAEQEGELKPSSPEGGGAIQSLPAGIEDRAVAVNPKPSNRVAKAVRLSDTFGRTWE